jgi:transposase
MVVALWHMLKHCVAHHDLGVGYFDHRNTDRARRHHVRRLERLGSDVVLVEKVA